MTDPDPGGETLFCCNADAGGGVPFVSVLTMFSLGEDKCEIGSRRKIVTSD
jgi:hypothetical protein